TTPSPKTFSCQIQKRPSREESGGSMGGRKAAPANAIIAGGLLLKFFNSVFRTRIKTYRTKPNDKTHNYCFIQNRVPVKRVGNAKNQSQAYRNYRRNFSIYSKNTFYQLHYCQNYQHCTPASN